MSDPYSGEGGLSDIRDRLCAQERIAKSAVTEGEVSQAIDAAMSDAPDFVVIFDNNLA